MNKYFYKTFFLLASFFMLPNLANAAPSVSGISGAITNGQSVTITGGGFGTKATPAPFKWDNFENGTVGATLSTQGYSAYDGTGAGTWPVYSTTRSYGQGTKSVYHSLNAGVEDFRDNGLAGLNSLEMYYSVMVYWENPSGILSGIPIIKFIRANSTNAGGGTCYYDSTNCRPHFYSTMRTNGAANDGGLDTGFTYNNSMIPDGAEHGYDVAHGYVNVDQGKWHRAEAYMKLSNPAGSNNGIFQTWVDGVLEYNFSGVTRDSSLAGKVMDSILLPVMASGNAMNLQFYTEDLYLDNTQARVEICNANMKAESTHCEVQPASEWTDTSAIITINQGSFANNSTVYLFVVAADGTINSTTAASTITFGQGSADTTAPAAPMGLSVM